MTAPEQGAYDEGAIKARLETEPASRRVAFASSCAEILFQLYGMFSRATGQGDPGLLRSALDVAWRASDAPSIASADVEARREDVESLVPSDDDDDWTILSPLAQNAAAAVAYALRAHLSGDPQDAVWAARQVYEAADFLVQLTGSEHSYVQSSSIDEVLTFSVRLINTTLVGLDSQSVQEMRAAAIADGDRLRQLVDGSSEP